MEAATGPPLLVGSCRLEPGANLQLPLSVYETLDQEVCKLDEDKSYNYIIIYVYSLFSMFLYIKF